jgi:hypothetical protein
MDVLKARASCIRGAKYNRFEGAVRNAGILSRWERRDDED